MKKRTIGAITSGVILLSVIAGGNAPKSNETSSKSSATPTTSPVADLAPRPKPTCDGTSIKSNCTIDNVNYKTYIYHPAVPEKSHTEQVTTYEQKVTGYCTLCQDGTYSPSCATGRGACSHHGGVAQWNAPRTSNVPVSSTKNVVDAPARAEYYEKIAE